MIETTTPPASRFDRTGKVLALFVVVLAIAAQIAGIALGAGGRFWPFLRYPMYATAGESAFQHQELCVFTADDSHHVTGWDIGITTFRFIGLLKRLSQEGPAGERARSRVAGLVARSFEPGARIEVWQADYEIGSEGLVDAAPPWHLVHAWQADTLIVGTKQSPALPSLVSGTPLPRSGQCGVGTG